LNLSVEDGCLWSLVTMLLWMRSMDEDMFLSKKSWSQSMLFSAILAVV
jgi:hypothetical protein